MSPNKTVCHYSKKKRNNVSCLSITIALVSLFLVVALNAVIKYRGPAATDTEAREALLPFMEACLVPYGVEFSTADPLGERKLYLDGEEVGLIRVVLQNGQAEVISLAMNRTAVELLPKPEVVAVDLGRVIGGEWTTWEGKPARGNCLKWRMNRPRDGTTIEGWSAKESGKLLGFSVERLGIK